MQNNKFKISYIISIILLGIIIFGLGFTNYINKNPINVYNVYLDGEIIGTIDDKDSFENYINKQEETIKKKYGVEKVYMPNGVAIKKVTTYNTNTDTNESVYKKIIKLKQFTIKGTVITISQEDDENYKTKHIYVLNKSIFDDALSELIKSFVDEDEYKAYMESSQKQIVDTGSVIKNIDVAQNITYKDSYIASRYLLEKAKENNNDLKYFIDLHRDSATYEMTTCKYDGKSYAKILFVLGMEFEGYGENEKMINYLNEKLKSINPCLSRGVSKKSGKGVNGIYNEDFDKNLILIEVGGQYNNIIEVSNTLEIFAKILSLYINEDSNEKT